MTLHLRFLRSFRSPVLLLFFLLLSGCAMTRYEYVPPAGEAGVQCVTRCTEARERYQKMMDARRLYEPGSTPDERRYLDAAETDAARANARKVMDDFCAGR